MTGVDSQTAFRLRAGWITTFFPNRGNPSRTVFIRNLALAMQRQAQITVTAPVPWVPPMAGGARWRRLREIPQSEEVSGIAVEHPRFVAIPGLEIANGFSYSLAVRSGLSRRIRGSELDLVHVHCAYPDAVGVARALGRQRLPLVITAHGSDINKYARRRGLTSQIRRALLRADAVVAVSARIAAAIAELAPSVAERISQIPCSGFDNALFAPRDRQQARERRGLQTAGRMLLFVGNLVPVKGPETLLAAWERLHDGGLLLADDQLCVLGEGTLRPRLERRIAQMRSGRSVRLLGPRQQSEVADWVAACDALCLASLDEGMPNVVIEALASGRPVAATAVGGVPDVVVDGQTGYLAKPGSEASLAQAISRVFAQEWDATQIRQAVAGYNWGSLADRNLAIYRTVCRSTSGN